MQTRYQLVQTYFINISTTNHRVRAVRIHPSRAVFRKDEKFSESLYILGGNPKKSSSNARKQKAKERGISRSIHARAIQTMLYHLSLSLSLSREADNHRRRQQKRMLCAYLCHFIFMSLQCVLMKLNVVAGGAAPQQIRQKRLFRKKREKNREEEIKMSIGI